VKTATHEPILTVEIEGHQDDQTTNIE